MPCSFARGIIRCPAVTSVSLFASAISLPAEIAAMEGRIPTIPTIAVTRMSTSEKTAISISPSIPQTTGIFRSAVLNFSWAAAFSSHTATSFGFHLRICFSRSSVLPPHASATTSKSRCSSITESVCVPIDPVDPNTAIFFIMHVPHTFISHTYKSSYIKDAYSKSRPYNKDVRHVTTNKPRESK